MEPTIKELPTTRLIGQKIMMSLAHNKTRELWQGFMPRRSEVPDTIGADLYSVEVYPDTISLQSFDPQGSFEKWAAVPVTEAAGIPPEMESLTIPAGSYAVFRYRGKASEAPRIYQHIFGVWLPSSGYVVDHRPHFAVMGEKYLGENPESEEDIWIPVRKP